mmetsp:Transcript_23100/g.46118  ORF Transcript_23100/g.46118 Transcript_23100/m.46118 type:complete len:171 (+) Transcript_23100:1732-2244(+)
MASNHRTGFVDLDVDTLFGATEDVTHRSSRNLHTNYPERVKKYLAEALEQFNRRNILTSMNKLTKRTRRAGTCTPKMQTKYDNIDKEAREIMLKVESNFVKTFRFTTTWSVPLIRASKVTKFWNLRLPMENGRQVAPSVLESVRASTDIADFTSSKEHVVVERNLARINL